MSDHPTVARTVLDTLHRAGIDTVFGIPGLHTLELWDALPASGLRWVVTRHEQAAAMAADGYARASGRPAAVLAITGPGATNTLTGVATAFVDSVPMVVITGQVASHHIGRDAGTTHELRDQGALFREITAGSFRVGDAATAPGVVADALRAASSGRPRPVHIEIPLDVQGQTIAAAGATERYPPATPALSPDTLEEIASLLERARRPVIYLGGGALDAGPAVQRLAERLGAAVLSTTMGRGIVPDDHPLALGNAWTKATHGGPAERLLASCDLMIALGVTFGGNPTGAWSLPVPDTLIHIDLDPTVPNRHHPARVAAQADAGLAARQLCELIGKRADPGFADEVAATYDIVQSACPPETRLLLDSLRRAVGREGTVVNDVTVIAYSAGSYLPVFRPRSYLSPAKFGTLGFGLPAGIGAKLAAPEHPLLVVCGDGGLLLNCHELATAAQERLPMAILVHNDRGYGAIRKSQERNFGGRLVGVELHTPDMERLAGAFAIRYTHPEDHDELERSVAAAVQGDGPTLIEWTRPLPFPW